MSFPRLVSLSLTHTHTLSVASSYKLNTYFYMCVCHAVERIFSGWNICRTNTYIHIRIRLRVFVVTPRTHTSCIESSGKIGRANEYSTVAIYIHTYIRRRAGYICCCCRRHRCRCENNQVLIILWVFSLNFNYKWTKYL